MCSGFLRFVPMVLGQASSIEWDKEKAIDPYSLHFGKNATEGVCDIRTIERFKDFL